MMIQMRSEINLKKNEMFSFLIIVMILLSLFSHFASSVFGIGNIYYSNYVCWLLFFTYGISGRNYRIDKKFLFIICGLIINCIFAICNRERIFRMGFVDIHQNLMFCLVCFFTLSFNYKTHLSQNKMLLICRVIHMCGVVACIYAMLVQTQDMIYVLRNINVSWYSWLYKSFFLQRNIFACFCFLCLVPTCYLYDKTHKKIYAITIILLAFQIYITNSRSALVSFLLLLGLYLYLKSRKKIVLVSIIMLSILILLNTYDIYGWAIKRMSHVTSIGYDSGIIRVKMWVDGITDLLRNHAFLNGYGEGSSELLLKQNYNLGSFHNVYIETLFVGGIIQLLFLLYVIRNSYKWIRQNQDTTFRYVWSISLIVFCIYSLFESGSMLFKSNYFSVLATIMFVLIPRYYQEG